MLLFSFILWFYCGHCMPQITTIIRSTLELRKSHLLSLPPHFSSLCPCVLVLHSACCLSGPPITLLLVLHTPLSHMILTYCDRGSTEVINPLLTEISGAQAA
jgi:hypothetical protein